MIEAHDEHHVAFLSRAHDHVSEKAYVFTYVEEGESVFKSVILYKQADFVGWFGLEPAMLDIKDLVKETAYVES